MTNRMKAAIALGVLLIVMGITAPISPFENRPQTTSFILIPRDEAVIVAPGEGHPDRPGPFCWSMDGEGGNGSLLLCTK